MKTTKITLRNDYHDTEVSVRAFNMASGNLRLTVAQVKRAQKALCCVHGCQCSNAAGVRGPQDGGVRVDVFCKRDGGIGGAIIYLI